MKILQKAKFRKVAKKLNPNQKKDLDKAIAFIIEEPFVGEEKKGDLRGYRVHKFQMVNQLTLIAYTFDEGRLILTLIAVGSHQNFYDDLKRKL